MKFKSIILYLLFHVSVIFANETSLSGIILDNEGVPVINVIIHKRFTDNGSYSDETGHFKLILPEGKHTISFTKVGFLKKDLQIELTANASMELNIELEPDPNFTLNDVVIVGKTQVRQIEESGFNVVAIDAKPYHNSSINLTQVLDRVPGVKIQQEGGLGSKTNTTINGLTGKHVRYFIDGMPMDAMSPAFQLNNLPVNMADRIEVYKGVVPVNFGSDALGGAVNIVTKKTPGTYLDASYSYGSFNTHLTYVNIGHTSKKGFTVQLSAYQNYSDNDYYVDARVADFDAGIYIKEPQRVRRFHDMYHNETVIAKIGVVEKAFADQLLFGITLGQEYREIQHPAYMNIAFGEKFHTSTIILPSFLYTKKDLFIKNLDVSMAANYNLGSGHNVDTTILQYNWLGDSRDSKSKGEMDYSDLYYKDNNGTINANLNYKINSKNRLTINNVTNLFSREGDNKVAIDDFMLQKPQVNNRNILGISLNSDFGTKFSTAIFGKYYAYQASAFLNTIYSSKLEDYQVFSISDSKLGYGLTASYFVNDNFQLKGNYELACRLPVSEELFGEVFSDPVVNLDLESESSNNFNLGFNYNKPINQRNYINTEVNIFYRRTSDFIRRNINYKTGQQTFENIMLVKIPGIDAEVRYSYGDRFNCGVNLSYQRPMNYDSTSTYYKGIVPNMPNFFGNADASYFINEIWFSESRLSFAYNLQFINEFLNDWSTYQSANSVPTQWNHSLNITYSWQKGKYNVAFDFKNIFDANLYDNYTLQKPGRSFAVKFRYYLRKT